MSLNKLYDPISFITHIINTFTAKNHRVKNFPRMFRASFIHRKLIPTNIENNVMSSCPSADIYKFLRVNNFPGL